MKPVICLKAEPYSQSRRHLTLTQTQEIGFRLGKQALYSAIHTI